MELETIDPHSQKEHTEIHKKNFKIYKEMYGIRTLCWAASGWPYISL